MKRIKELDSLRGIAAVAVLLYHFTTRYPELFPAADSPGFSLPFGRLGVHLFFILSGFVIPLTLERHTSFLTFALARFLRLYPVFWICLTVTFVAVSLAGLDGRTHGLGVYLINLTMVPALLKVPLIDGVYWSLQIELLFYFWAGLTCTVFPPRARVPLFLGWLVLAAGSAVFNHTVRAIAPLRMMNTALILEFAPLFILGILFYRLHSGQGTWRQSVTGMIAALAILGCGEGWEHAVFVGTSCVIFPLLMLKARRLLVHPILQFLGTVSYPLYVLHQNIGYVVLQWCGRNGIPVGAALLVAIAASLILAATVTYSVERPMMRFAKSAIPRLGTLRFSFDRETWWMPRWFRPRPSEAKLSQSP
jgi:peptidoglycan/LPS O-acetylase OafA/YrhL